MAASEKKRALIVYKDREVIGPRDYRAVLAFLLVAGYLYTLILASPVAIAGMGPLAGSAVTYYFHHRRR